MTQAAKDDRLGFADDTAHSAPASLPPWKILIADDEEGVHRVTRLALADLRFFDRPLQFLDAYSGHETVELMRQHPDTAMVLMDVVMESEHAGLLAVQTIRRELDNRFVRIILRTGQPGQAPEREVVTRYDINDYKEKTELTAKKLFTVIHTGLSHYREMLALNESKRGLERVLDATADIFEKKSLPRFAQGALEQLGAMLFADQDAVVVRAEAVAATSHNNSPAVVLAGTGRYALHRGAVAQDVVDARVMDRVLRVLRNRRSERDDREFIAYFSTSTGVEHVLYLGSSAPMSAFDIRLLELFCRNVGIAYENFGLQREMLDTQRNVILLLTEAIEQRSKETRNHVQRVAEYAATLGALMRLPEHELEILPLAAAMHDLGKVAIADAILTKPGPLTDAERKDMQLHAEIGWHMLSAQHGVILQAGAEVARQHHENWDGSGYPQGLAGEDIHLYGRIVKLVDVFDALSTKRCYKEAWPMQQVVDYLRQESGRQFEPRLVELLLNNLDRFLAIKAQYAEEPG
ncbi:MAG TPA: DUF3369 domain-containing protein [Candidatus Binatia bacterium]|nr:DUF3369 domain-containing protein [Candidatus Binatia bacterium]